MPPLVHDHAEATIPSHRVVLLAALLCAAPALPVTEAPSPPPPGSVLATMARGVDPTPAPSVDPAPVPPHLPEPAADPERPVAVEARPVDVRVDAAPPDAARRAHAVAGVAHATTVRVGRIDAGTGDLVVAAVAPDAYRPFAPQVVADETAVWARLAEGDLAVTHEHAARLDLALADQVVLGGADGVAVRVGALASNGLPPIADAIVSRTTGARLGLAEVAPTLLVAVEDGAAVDAVAEQLSRALGAEAVVAPDPRTARSVTPAPPAGDTVWDLLASCESSGDWHANTGNGYYGGLQFLPESWWWVGGTGMPHEATREEQILRAERLLALQGWEAWPVCSIRVGLRPDPNAA